MNTELFKALGKAAAVSVAALAMVSGSAFAQPAGQPFTIQIDGSAGRVALAGART